MTQLINYHHTPLLFIIISCLITSQIQPLQAQEIYCLTQQDAECYDLTADGGTVCCGYRDNIYYCTDGALYYHWTAAKWITDDSSKFEQYARYVRGDFHKSYCVPSMQIPGLPPYGTMGLVRASNIPPYTFEEAFKSKSELVGTYVLVNNTDQTIDKVNDILKVVSDLNINTITDELGRVQNNVTETIDNNSDQVISRANQLLKTVGALNTKMTDELNNLQRNVTEVMQRIATLKSILAGNNITQLHNPLVNISDINLDTLVFLQKFFLPPPSGIFSGFWDGLISIFSPMTGQVSHIAEFIINKAPYAIQNAENFFQKGEDFFGNIIKSIENFIKSIENFFNKIPDYIKEGLMKVLEFDIKVFLLIIENTVKIMALVVEELLLSPHFSSILPPIIIFCYLSVKGVGLYGSLFITSFIHIMLTYIITIIH